MLGLSLCFVPVENGRLAGTCPWTSIHIDKALHWRCWVVEMAQQFWDKVPCSSYEWWCYAIMGFILAEYWFGITSLFPEQSTLSSSSVLPWITIPEPWVVTSQWRIVMWPMETSTSMFSIWTVPISSKFGMNEWRETARQCRYGNITASWAEM